jgi:hypothetical protein
LISITRNPPAVFRVALAGVDPSVGHVSLAIEDFDALGKRTPVSEFGSGLPSWSRQVFFVAFGERNSLPGAGVQAGLLRGGVEQPLELVLILTSLLEARASLSGSSARPSACSFAPGAPFL